MKTTVKGKIMLFMNNRDWTSKITLESMSREWGALADNIDRRARELVNDGRLEKRINGKTVQYRIKPVVYTRAPTSISPGQPRLFDVPVKKSYVN